MPLGRNSTKSRGADAAIQRADVVDSTIVEGNLVKVKKPKYISIVGLPANQTGFKVVRSDEGDKPMSNVVVRRTRRSEQSPVLRLTFPQGTDEQTVNESLKAYGLSGYNVENKDGVFVATRADLKSVSTDGTQEIKLSEDGLVATVARATSLEGNVEKSKLTMSSLEFDGTKFTLDEVKRWVAENSVDGTVEETQNSGGNYVVRRSEVPENEETRQMVLEDGVTAVIMRSDAMAVPDGFIAVVNETAYGNWGWGQLDFAAAMADQEFSEAMREAIYTLNDVLRNIVIYSPLPLDVRKELANRALGQFGEFVGTVMDSLPRQLLVSVVRSAKPTQENSMSKAQQGGSATTTAGAQEEKKPTDTITRAEAQAMVDEAVKAALASVQKTEPAPAAQVARADDGQQQQAATQAAPAAGLSITRDDLASAFATALAPVVEGVKGLQGLTVLRDGGGEQVPGKTDDAKRGDDVWKGSMPGLRRAK